MGVASGEICAAGGVGGAAGLAFGLFDLLLGPLQGGRAQWGDELGDVGVQGAGQLDEDAEPRVGRRAFGLIAESAFQQAQMLQGDVRLQGDLLQGVVPFLAELAQPLAEGEGLLSSGTGIRHSTT